MKKVLAVIPARGGSKGIPRKNVRLMNGKPLLYYAIRNALECELITDVAVTSDDEEIKRIAGIYGASVINRDASLAKDHVTLDPVIVITSYSIHYTKLYEILTELILRTSLRQHLKMILTP